MKRKLEIGLLAAVAVIAVAVFFLIQNTNQEPSSSSGSGSEITIRNVTKSVIGYSIKPYNSFNPPENKRLEVAKIHRFSTQAQMDISYEQLGKVVTRHLSPGKSYSFRYDENNLIHIYEGSHGREDAVDLAPYVTTPMEVVEKMLEMADVDQDDVLYDLGCGDGRIVIAAAERYGARGVGIDIDPRRIEESKKNAVESGVDGLVKFYVQDATKVDVSEATVVTLYLLPESNELLRPKFEKELKPGAYVISHNYNIPGWSDKEAGYTAVETPDGQQHTIFLYKR